MNKSYIIFSVILGVMEFDNAPSAGNYALNTIMYNKNIGFWLAVSKDVSKTSKPTARVWVRTNPRLLPNKIKAIALLMGINTQSDGKGARQ